MTSEPKLSATDSLFLTGEKPPEPQTPEQIMRACYHDGPRDSYYKTPGGETITACWRCGNAAGEVSRQQRKAQLAARPKDCQRCGQRPHTWTYGGFRLCGRCKTATEREHNLALSRAGVLGIFATRPLVDTSGWAARQGRTP